MTGALLTPDESGSNWIDELTDSQCMEVFWLYVDPPEPFLARFPPALLGAAMRYALRQVAAGSRMIQSVMLAALLCVAAACSYSTAAPSPNFGASYRLMVEPEPPVLGATSLAVTVSYGACGAQRAFALRHLVGSTGTADVSASYSLRASSRDRFAIRT